MRDHTKLRAFELADNLALAIYQVTSSFPNNEMFGLTSQLRRAAVSIASNIVEGSARNSMAEYIKFLNIAYGSAKEVEYQISLAYRLHYIEEANYKTLKEQCIETSKVLNALLRSLRSIS
ncbi:MAG: four helix bundle protein [Phycisphaerae bacterium]|nr:four helix bundle protein [Phycisphaerae bacterium]